MAKKIRKKKMSRGERVLQMALVLPVLIFFIFAAINNPTGAGSLLAVLGMITIPAIPISIICNKLLEYDKKYGSH